jgi:hypothetical protein
VVNEFSDVFPEELPGMPPDRDIEFVIDLMPGTAPTYKRPYMMATQQLAELKERIRATVLSRLVSYSQHISDTTCHTPFRERGNEASIRVPRMFKSHV